ncbi:MAG: hypothetical protein JW700_01470 [Candidatus Aenigmarchaeota archaeon]|nr:hypothetical protein [Candidatus Aenigmarchaeota archaeon]
MSVKIGDKEVIKYDVILGTKGNVPILYLKNPESKIEGVPIRNGDKTSMEIPLSEIGNKIKQNEIDGVFITYASDGKIPTKDFEKIVKDNDKIFDYLDMYLTEEDVEDAIKEVKELDKYIEKK